jgi:hypothetical protein
MTDLVTLKTSGWMREGFLRFEKISDSAETMPENTHPLKISFSPHMFGVLMIIGATKTILNGRAIADLTTRLNSIQLGEVVLERPEGDRIYFTKTPYHLRITLRSYSFLFDAGLTKYLLDALPVMVIAGSPIAMPRHPAIERMANDLRAAEVASAKDLVATEEERNYRSPLSAQELLEQLRKEMVEETIEYQNMLNHAMLTGQTEPDSSKNQARINQGLQ